LGEFLTSGLHRENRETEGSTWKKKGDVCHSLKRKGKYLERLVGLRPQKNVGPLGRARRGKRETANLEKISCSSSPSGKVSTRKNKNPNKIEKNAWRKGGKRGGERNPLSRKRKKNRAHP